MKVVFEKETKIGHALPHLDNWIIHLKDSTIYEPYPKKTLK